MSSDDQVSDLPPWPSATLEITKPQLWSPDDAKWLSELEQRYDAWRPTSQRRIPRVLHQIWLGPKEVPFKDFRRRWQELHPEWEYKLWRDADLSEFGLTNHRAYQAATNYGAKSDIARYEILHRLGGVYVDVDMEPLRALDPLLNVGLFVGFSNVGAVEINNALLGSTKGHPILAACINRIASPSLGGLLVGSGFLDPTAALALTSTIADSGPGLLTQIFCGSSSSEEDAVCLPPEVFYPAPNHARGENEHLSAFATPLSFTIHHWATSWQS